MKEKQLTRQEAIKAVLDADWAMKVGVAYAAVTGLVSLNLKTPAELKAVLVGGFIASGINAARRSLGERLAMEQHPGIENVIKDGEA
jgi:hypothetical protein